jgi:UDP-N-acetylglucosamine--N-acetylmuramyl-(pentapeptide) pyrophosphoryl-undecaprenol N-acetylglucosamine transferase
LKKLGLHPHRHLVAVVGGSQGARGLNEAMIRGLEALQGQAQTMQILHVAGEAHVEKVRKAYGGRGFHAVVLGFCDEMEAVYAAADLVVSRSGAGTLAELATCRVPAILVPFPAAAGNHQMANAQAYGMDGAAEVVGEKYLVGAELGQRIARLLMEKTRLGRMSHLAHERQSLAASEKIAEAINHVL